MHRKLSPTARLFAVLAVVFGTAAFLVVRSYAARVAAIEPALGRAVPIVVAARDLPRGAAIPGDALRLRSYPSSFAPPGAFGRIAEVIGRVPLAPVAEGEPVTASRLGPRAGPLAALVPTGMQAFPVQATLPRWSVRPGDRVDVLATFAGGRPHTETLATGLEVLEVLGSGGSSGGGVTGETSPGGPVLLVLVRPDQAEQLAYAQAFANLTVLVEGAGVPTAEASPAPEP